MPRPKKRYTEEELQANADAAKKRRQDAEQRAKDARKAEADALKALKDLRAEERQRRMEILLGKLTDLGYPLDSEDDITAIMAILAAGNIIIRDNIDLDILLGLRDTVESAARRHIRTEADLQQFSVVLENPRTWKVTENPVALAALIARGYDVDLASRKGSKTTKMTG